MLRRSSCLLLSIVTASMVAGCGGIFQDEKILVLGSTGEVTAFDKESIQALPDRPGAGLMFYVSDAFQGGNPIARAEVEVNPSGAPPKIQSTDANGVCLFPDLAPGEYAVSINHYAYAPNRAMITTTRASQIVKVVLVLGPQIQGSVYDAVSKAPVKDFELMFEGDAFSLSPRWRQGFVEFTTEDGQFTATGVHEAWRIVVRAPGYRPYDYLVPGEWEKSVSQSLKFPLERSPIVQGTITDLHDRPIAGVAIFPRDRGTRGYIRPVHTNEEGAFRLDMLSKTPLEFVISHPGFAPALLEVPHMQTGETLELNATLHHGVDVRGTVKLDDEPVGNAQVIVEVPQLRDRERGVTSRQGEFSVANVPPGLVRVYAEVGPEQTAGAPSNGPTRTAMREVELSDGQKTSIDFAFTSHGTMVEGFVLYGEDPVSAQVSTDFTRNGAAIRVESHTDDGGWYQLTALPAGDLVVTVAHSGRSRTRESPDGHVSIPSTRTFTLSLPEEGYVQQNFDISQGAVIHGNINGIDDADRMVYVGYRRVDEETNPDGASAADFSRVSQDGRFSIVGLAPGTYQLNAVASRYGPRDRRRGDTSRPVESAAGPTVEVHLTEDEEKSVELTLP